MELVPSVSSGGKERVEGSDNATDMSKTETVERKETGVVDRIYPTPSECEEHAKVDIDANVVSSTSGDKTETSTSCDITEKSRSESPTSTCVDKVENVGETAASGHTQLSVEQVIGMAVVSAQESCKTGEEDVKLKDKSKKKKKKKRSGERKSTKVIGAIKPPEDSEEESLSTFLARRRKEKKVEDLLKAQKITQFFPVVAKVKIEPGEESVGNGHIKNCGSDKVAVMGEEHISTREDGTDTDKKKANGNEHAISEAVDNSHTQTSVTDHVGVMAADNISPSEDGKEIETKKPNEDESEVAKALDNDETKTSGSGDLAVMGAETISPTEDGKEVDIKKPNEDESADKGTDSSIGSKSEMTNAVILHYVFVCICRISDYINQIYAILLCSRRGMLDIML